MRFALKYAVFLSVFLTGVGAAPTTLSSLSDLPYDENGKLSTHMLVYPERCASVVEKNFPSGMPYGFRYHSVAGEAQEAYFPKHDAAAPGDPLQNIKDCPAICVERGVDQSVINSAMPKYHYDGRANFRDWFSSECTAVEQGFMSYHHNPVNYYWVDHKGELSPRGVIPYGEKNTKFLETYIGHKFVLKDAETEEVLLEHTVEFNSIVSIGLGKSLIDKSVDNVRRIQSTLNSEWRRHLRVKRTFTPLGFSKGRLPDDLFASMGAYYYNNRNNIVIEEWESKGLFVNFWEADVYFVQLPWHLKTVYQKRLQELVEEWVGVELDYTDLYGMRRYEGGARLLSHVDRESTHAASLIINIEQGNLTAPWTVEVHDHAERLHEVVMSPGDIVYYESAKCLHGRNTPLPGGYYVNVFAHYRPKGDPQWYIRDNPDGTPEPLMDVGECKLVGEIDQYSQGAVQCDNAAIGPHLSPKLFTARSGDDLFDYWRMVGDGFVPGGAVHEEL